MTMCTACGTQMEGGGMFMQCNPCRQIAAIERANEDSRDYRERSEPVRYERMEPTTGLMRVFWKTMTLVAAGVFASIAVSSPILFAPFFWILSAACLIVLVTT